MNKEQFVNKLTAQLADMTVHLIEYTNAKDKASLPPEPDLNEKPTYRVGMWYPWTGGECPVPADTRVRYLLRDGYKATHPADSLTWRHDIICMCGDLNCSMTGVGDIVAFKIKAEGK